MIVSAKVTSADMNAVLQKVLKDVEGNVDKGLDKIAGEVRSEAKAASEFTDRSGRLRRSIKKQKVRGGYEVKATAPHAHLVEFGHWLTAWGNPTGDFVPPRPFMRNSLDNVAGRAESILRENL